MEKQVNDITQSPQVRALSVVGPDTQDMVRRVSAEIAMADSIVIDSPEMLAEAQEIAGKLSSVAKAIEEERKERAAPVREILDWLNAGYGQARDHIQGKVDSIKPKIVTYNAEVRRAAEAAAAAERARREAQAQAAAKAEAEAAAKAKAMMAEAAAAQAAGSEIVAAAIAEQAAAIVDISRSEAQAAAQMTQAVMAPAVKAKGVRVRWSGVVTSKSKVILAVAKMIEAGDESLAHLLEVDASALNKLADLQREHFRLDGAMAVANETVSVRRVAA